MPRRKSSKAQSSSLSYADAGVDITASDEAKEAMAKAMETSDRRVLSTPGNFAALYDGSFPGYEHPVLVLKTEEPGTKQLLAFRNGRIASICQDMIHHLINDIAVMGADPLCVQDAIICGSMEKQTVAMIVSEIASACRAQGCVLVGGETSVQPGVLPPEHYILTASVLGIVERDRIIDGSRIQEGDAVIAIASNGLHTNGYSLVRALMDKCPEILEEKIDGRSFLDAILTPHLCYYQALSGLYDLPALHGMAHITGSGIEGNLERILPQDLDASIDLSRIRVLPVFRVIQARGNIANAEMLHTFNMGVGLTVVCESTAVEVIRQHLSLHGHESYVIGEIVQGKGKVVFQGELKAYGS